MSVIRILLVAYKGSINGGLVQPQEMFLGGIVKGIGKTVSGIGKTVSKL